MCKSNDNKNDEVVSENQNTQLSEPIEVVKLFIESLGKKDFQTAYNLQKIDSWGTFNDFSSTKAFGGINATSINEIKQLPDENGKSVIFVDAYYYDPVNGDNRFEENFYLQKINDEWKITDFKIVSTKSSTNSDFETFLALFDKIQLPFDGSRQNLRENEITEDFKERFIYKYDNDLKSDNSILTTVCKFDIQNKYIGVIFSGGELDFGGVIEYLFIYDLDSNFKSNLPIGEEFMGGMGTITTEYSIDKNFNITLKTMENIREGAELHTGEWTTETYSIINGIITKE